MQKGGVWIQIACKIAYVLNGRPLTLQQTACLRLGVVIGNRGNLDNGNISSRCHCLMMTCIIKYIEYEIVKVYMILLFQMRLGVRTPYSVRKFVGTQLAVPTSPTQNWS